MTHLDELGGLSAQVVAQANRAGLLYRAIDASNGFYINKVNPSVRSRMNVPFNLQTPELEAQFLAEASALPRPLPFMYGHPSRGGVRVTTYNWITAESIEHVHEFMVGFAKRHQSNPEL